MPPAPLTFGAFADPHFADKLYADRYCGDSLAKVRECITAFNRQDLTLAICLGDVIDKVDDREEEILYLKRMEDGPQVADHHVDFAVELRLAEVAGMLRRVGQVEDGMRHRL